MNVHYSSKTDEWGTPPDLFEKLNAEFNFTPDVCATPGRQMVSRYFSPEQDGLAQPWALGEVCWMNPPYGREISKWVKKAHDSRARVVGLLPARTDTAWWHDYVMIGNTEIRFLRGRLKFRDATGQARYPAPFPSAVVIWY